MKARCFFLAGFLYSHWFSLSNRHIANAGIILQSSHVNFKSGFHCWLIKAWEGPSGIGCFKLRRGQPFFLVGFLVCVATPVESCQAIRQFSIEGDGDVVFGFW